MNQVILARLFYFLLLFVTLPKTAFVLSVDFNATRIFSIFADQNLFVFFTFFIFIISTAYCCFSPKMLVRVLTAFAFTILHLGFRSQLETSYNLFSWNFAVILMAFWKYSEQENNRNRNIVTVVQIFILGIYFSAGLWKVRSFFNTDAARFFTGALDQIAFATAAGVGPVNYVNLNFSFFKYVILIGFPLILLFQLTAFIPVFYRKYLPHWGVAAVVFHFSTGIFMNIWFECHQVVSCLFLIIIPLYFESKKQDADCGSHLQSRSEKE